MKKFKYILFIIPILFLFINTVKADTVSSYYIQDTDSIKSTSWTVGDSWLYEDNGILFTNTTDKYFVIETCLTGYLDFEITNNIAGSISFLGEMSGEYCNCQGYNGAVYKYVFKVNQFDVSVTGTNPQVRFALRVSNPQSYKVYQDFLNVYSSTHNPITDAEANETLKDMNDNIVDTNNKLDNIDDTLTDDSSPDLGALDNSAGWLPAGPVDSILNLPLSLLNNLSSTLNKSCNSVILTLPYINKTITLPCITDLYDKMGVTGTIFSWAGIIAAAFILYKYLLNLYKWVDDTLTMRENNLPGYFDDNWGGGA